jgi:hypothetical protein
VDPDPATHLASTDDSAILNAVVISPQSQRTTNHASNAAPGLSRN